MKDTRDLLKVTGFVLAVVLLFALSANAGGRQSTGTARKKAGRGVQVENSKPAEMKFPVHVGVGDLFPTEVGSVEEKPQGPKELGNELGSKQAVSSGTPSKPDSNKDHLIATLGGHPQARDFQKGYLMKRYVKVKGEGAASPNDQTTGRAKAAVPPDPIKPSGGRASIPPDPVKPGEAKASFPPDPYNPTVAKSGWPPDPYGLGEAKASAPPDPYKATGVKASVPPDPVKPGEAKASFPPDPIEPSRGKASIPPDPYNPGGEKAG
jgi:hypothetical protein